MFSLRLLLLVPLAVSVFAQSRSACTVLTLSEATAALGPGTEQKDVSGICIFTSKKTSITVTLTANGGNPFQIMKLTASQNGAAVKDEPGIGAPAFSVVPKDGHGFSIFVLKGTWGSAISADAGPVRISDPVREKLRVLAKQAAARM